MEIVKKMAVLILLVQATIGCNKNQEIPQTLKGFLTLGNEVSDFEDCNKPGVQYWVEDQTGSLDSLYKLVASSEYEPVFIQMEALKLPPLKLGYAEERNGLIRVQKILKMEKKNVQNNCLL